MVLSIVVTVFMIYNFFTALKGNKNVYAEAIQMAEKGKFVDARGLLRSRLDQNPNDSLAHYHISRIYSMEGNIAQELHHLAELKRINILPKGVDPVVLFSRAAYLHYEQNKLAGAFDNFLSMLEFDPKNEMALAHVAFLAIGQQEFNIAERYFSRLVELSPQVKEYHIARAVGLAMLKQEKSIESFDRALEIDPEEHTALILKSIECLRQKKGAIGHEAITRVTNEVEDQHILYIAHKLATVLCYLEKDYDRSIEHAEFCEKNSKQNAWLREYYDSLLSVALLSILHNNLPRASECLLELEMSSPANETIIALSDFRVDLADGRAQLNQVSPRGFDFVAEMQLWLKTRFPENTIYKLSGLEQSENFDVLRFFSREGKPQHREGGALLSVEDPELIGQFNELSKQEFEKACQKIITLLGFKTIKNLNYRDTDGEDYLGQSLQSSKNTALFRIRKWSNQAISDIFLREQQSFMNEQNVSLGFVIASTQLTAGASEVLKSLKRITVINENRLAEILKQVL